MKSSFLSKKYKIDKSIDQLWNEFKNDNEFKNIKVDAIEKMATDTYFFTFTFHKNRYFGIQISVLCGTAVSSGDGWSNVDIKPKQRTGVSSLLIFGAIFFLFYAGTSLFPF